MDYLDKFEILSKIINDKFTNKKGCLSPDKYIA